MNGLSHERRFIAFNCNLLFLYADVLFLLVIWFLLSWDLTTTSNSRLCTLGLLEEDNTNLFIDSSHTKAYQRIRTSSQLIISQKTSKCFQDFSELFLGILNYHKLADKLVAFRFLQHAHEIFSLGLPVSAVSMKNIFLALTRFYQCLAVITLLILLQTLNVTMGSRRAINNTSSMDLKNA